jgi:hypothetical protein
MTPKQALSKANGLWGKGKEYYSAGGHINKRKPCLKVERGDPAPWKFDVGFVSNLFIPNQACWRTRCSMRLACTRVVCRTLPQCPIARCGSSRAVSTVAHWLHGRSRLRHSETRWEDPHDGRLYGVPAEVLYPSLLTTQRSGRC